MEWILFAAVALVAVVVVVVYNRLVSLRQSARQAYADIDAQLRLRTDLVPNLVETVKGYARHEKDTLEQVMKARAESMEARASGNVSSADSIMTAALGRLFAVAEAYPELKANQNFLQLQQELSDVENKIAAARRFLNASVADYNGAIEQFPAVLFAKRLGFRPESMFELPASSRADEEPAPSVSF